MDRRLMVFGASLSVVLMGGFAGAAIARPSDPVAPPPAVSALVQATNAMLRSGDVPNALARIPSDTRPIGETAVGFFNPPGGQDPTPVCVYGTSYRAVGVPLAMATGFNASVGVLEQTVYQYGSAAAASKAWRKLSRQIDKRCTGSFTDNGRTFTSQAARIPGVGGVEGWGVNSRGFTPRYVTVHLLGDAISMLAIEGEKGKITARQVNAANALAGALAVRWVDRATLAVTQNPFTTQAENAMVQPADLPAALPITAPTSGGWSTFRGYLPGFAPSVCDFQAKLPAAAQTYGASYGGQGDAASIPGAVSQTVNVYGSSASAQAAWTRLTAAVGTCKENLGKSIPARKSFLQQNNGVSPVVVGGTAGVWSNTLDIEDVGFSQRTYTVHLLVGDAISSLSYTRGVNGMRDVGVDESAVNALAQALAVRWAAGSAQAR